MSFYAVAIGRNRGVFTTWKECHNCIDRYKGAVYKKFPTRAAATEWLEPAKVKRPKTVAPTVVYTDGACPNNQDKHKARAGVGVWFNDGDVRNVSEPLPGKATNQRAELMAVIRALEQEPAEDLHIYSDSEYVVLGVKYRLTGWARDSFRKVDNDDLWRRLHVALQENRNIELEHVDGHSGNVGNEAADKLAVAGSLKAQ